MKNVSVCSECGGKGSYVIRNAYDPDFKEEIDCEYCDNGVVLTTLSFERANSDRKSKDEDWLN